MVQPYPGSELARKKGCICPVTHNNKGAGIVKNNQRFFIVSGSCRGHGLYKEAKPNEKDAAMGRETTA